MRSSDAASKLLCIGYEQGAPFWSADMETSTVQKIPLSRTKSQPCIAFFAILPLVSIDRQCDVDLGLWLVAGYRHGHSFDHHQYHAS